MDRLRVRFSAWLLVVATAHAAHLAGADEPARAPSRAVKEFDELPPLKFERADGKPPTLEQTRVSYVLDRKVKEAEYRLTGKDAEGALKQLDEIVAEYRRAGMFDDRQNFHAQFWYAIIHELRKKPAEVEAAFAEAIKLAERTYGAESRQAAEPRLRWGQFGLRNERDLDRTQLLFEEATAIYRKLGDLESKAFLGATQGVGVVAIKRKRGPEAVAYLREVCEGRREHHADDFQTRALSHHFLGIAYTMSGDFPAARTSFDESAEYYEKVQGRDGKDVQEERRLALTAAQATTKQVDIAQAELELKSLEEQYRRQIAAKNKRDALATSERMDKIFRSLGTTIDESQLALKHRIAILHSELDEPEKGAEEFAEVLKLAERCADCPPVLIGNTAFRLGMVELQRERFAAAGRALRRADQYYATAQNEEWHRWTIQAGLAAVEIQAKNYKLGLDHLDAMVALMPARNLPAARSTLLARARMACICYEDPALRERCDAMLTAARAEALTEYGDQDLVFADVLHCVAHVQYVEADPACVLSATEALAIQASLLPVDDRELLGNEIAQAKMCRAFGELDRARRVLDAVVVKLKAVDKPERLRADALQLLAGIDAHQGRKSDAEARYREVIALRTKLDGADDETVEENRKTLDAYLAGTLPSLKPADNPDEFVIKATLK